MRAVRHPGASTVLAPLLLCFALAACQRGIGDACETALRCSTSGTRLCDQTQPGGYCTLANCDVDTCPEESACVRFWPHVNREQDSARVGVNYCMRKCTKRSDCRDSEGYDCLSQSEFGAGAIDSSEPIEGPRNEAEVLGHPTQRFCAVRSHPLLLPDAGAEMSVADAGAEMSVADAGADAGSVIDAGGNAETDAAVDSSDGDAARDAAQAMSDQ